MAEAIAARVRAAHDVDVAWFTVSERDGTIDPPLPSADALHAAVTKPLAAAAAAASASSPRSPIGIEPPSDATLSAAALIAKGEAAVRLGDHRRANEAFAAARAMQELDRSRSASPPGGSSAAAADESESDASGAAVVAAFAPFVLALLPDGAAHLGVAVDAATATNAHAHDTTVVGSNPGGGVGGVFVNLGDASEAAVARAARRCRDAGVGFVQAALAGDAADARKGTVRAWVASAEGPAVVSAAIAVALAPVCGGRGRRGEARKGGIRRGEDDGEDDGDGEADARRLFSDDFDASAAPTTSTPSLLTVLSETRDPRAACTTRAAVLAELVREQASALAAAESTRRANASASADAARWRETARRAESDANAAASAVAEAESRLREAASSRARDLAAAEAASRTERRRLESLLADAHASARSSAIERDALLARVRSLETTSRDAESRAAAAEARAAAAEDAKGRAEASRAGAVAAAEEAARRVEDEREADKASSDAEIARLRERLESARVASAARLRAEGDVADASRARDAAEAAAAASRRERDDAMRERDAAIRSAEDAERRAGCFLARAEAAEERARDADARLDIRRATESAEAECRAKAIVSTLDRDADALASTLAETRRLRAAADAAERRAASAESSLSDALRRAEDAERDAATLSSRLASVEAEVRSARRSDEEYARVVGGLRRVAAAAESAAREATNAAEETARRAIRRAELADAALAEAEATTRAIVEAAARDADANIREETARREEDARVAAEKMAALERALQRATRDAAKHAARADAARETVAEAVAAVAEDVPPRAGVIVDLTGLDDAVAAVTSERAANAAAKMACARLERATRGARACVVARKPSRRAGKPEKIVVVAAGAMSTMVEWFGARGWSSAVAPGSLAGECLEAERRRRVGVASAGTHRRDETVFSSEPGPGPGSEPGPDEDESRRASPGHLAALLARVTCVRGGKTAPGFAVACGPRRALTVDFAERDGAPPPTIPELVAAHEIARVVQAAYDAADDAERRNVRNDARLTREELKLKLRPRVRSRLEGDDQDSANGHRGGGDAGFEKYDHPTTVASATRRLETLATRRRLVVSRAASVGCLRESRREGAGPTPRDALALAVSAWAAAAAAGDPRCPPMRREDLDAFEEAARARIDADAVAEEKKRERTLTRAMRVRPRERDHAADEARVDAARRAARRVAPRAIAMWFGGGGSGSGSGRGVGEAIDAFVDDDLRAMRRVDLRAERNLADVERALAIAAPFVFGGGEGEGEGDEDERGGEEGGKEGEDPDAVHADAAMTCWAWAASCVATWRARRFIAEHAKPGVFDLEIVDAEARARAAAGDVVTRYARRYARRFFENAKRRRREPGEPGS